MIVGFTGTQRGMNRSQRDGLHRLLTSWHSAGDVFRHGDCTGADAEAHDIAKECGYIVVIHPPIKEFKRAFCQGADLVLTPKEYLERNHDIVDACDVLLAAPGENKEQLRSGTWATMRYAKKNSRKTLTFMPDGNVYTSWMV